MNIVLKNYLRNASERATIVSRNLFCGVDNPLCWDIFHIHISIFKNDIHNNNNYCSINVLIYSLINP